MRGIELVLEKWLPVAVAVAFAAAIAWRFGGEGWGELLQAPREIFYQTMLMFSTIVVALMATFKAIIFTAERNSGIDLLKSNPDMHRRFICYIFTCILGNLAFSLFSFVLMIVAYKLTANLVSSILVFLAVYSVMALLRVLILFQIIVTKRS